ncbi:MAG: hypothetical protein IT430_09865 [Phycisphaerales bacterium]|nr:hypothetical protein [Phycisphaerales bacterium]
MSLTSGLTGLTNAKLTSWRKLEAADEQGRAQYGAEQIAAWQPRIVVSLPGYKHTKTAEASGFAVSAVLLVPISLDVNAGDRVMSDHPDVAGKALIIRLRKTVNVPGLKARELLCEWEVGA